MKRYRLHCKKSGRFWDRGLPTMAMVEKAVRRLGLKDWWVEEVCHG